MLNRILVTVGLLCSLAFAATNGSKGIKLDSTLRVYEDLDMLATATLDVEGDSHGKYFPRLVLAAERRGVEVVFADELLITGIPKGEIIWGFYDQEDNVIYLNAHQSLNALLTTLFHELGHAIGPEELKGQVDGQVFAEALAALSTSQLKLDTFKPSFLYLQQFPNRHAVIQKYAKQLEKLSDELVAEVR